MLMIKKKKTLEDLELKFSNRCILQTDCVGLLGIKTPSAAAVKVIPLEIISDVAKYHQVSSMLAPAPGAGLTFLTMVPFYENSSSVH